jgi:hypothetical protein
MACCLSSLARAVEGRAATRILCGAVMGFLLLISPKPL